jgi:ribulose 1,5-bisphosphate synthetase/thiazole synthase
MILFARQIPDGSTQTADVCIIGAGPAGITIANEIAGVGAGVNLSSFSRSERACSS